MNHIKIIFQTILYIVVKSFLKGCIRNKSQQKLPEIDETIFIIQNV